MAIPLEGFAGYIRTRPSPLDRKAEKKEDGSTVTTNTVELWIDPIILHARTDKGLVVTKPKDCAGILYATADGKLEVRYPEE